MGGKNQTMARLIVFRRGCAWRESLTAPATCTKADRGRRLACAGGTLRSVFRVVFASAGSPPTPRAYQTSSLCTSPHREVLRSTVACSPGFGFVACAHFPRPGMDYPPAATDGSGRLTKPACSADNSPAPQGPCNDALPLRAPPPCWFRPGAPTHQPGTCKSSSCDHLAASRCGSG